MREMKNLKNLLKINLKKLDCFVAPAPRNDVTTMAECVSSKPSRHPELYKAKHDGFQGDVNNDKNLVPQCHSPLMPFSKPSKKAAFTLAETLIALGVIGVVAAIILPSVIGKIQDRQNIVKWKKEYSVISNAFQNTLLECEPVLEWSPSGTDYTQEFIDQIFKRLDVVDYCYKDGTRRCDNYNYTDISAQKKAKYKWSGTASDRSRYKALGVTGPGNGTYTQYNINAYNFTQAAYLLRDGASVYFGGLHGGPWIVVDVNNFQKGPNEFGKDVFVMRVIKQKSMYKLLPMGAQGTFNTAKNGETCECSPDKGVKGGDWLAGGGGDGEVISGICCSAKYLNN